MIPPTVVFKAVNESLHATPLILILILKPDSQMSSAVYSYL